MKVLQPDIAFIFIGGFFLAMSLIHFVLFMYNRHRKANLVYSLGIFMAFINYALIPISTDPNYNYDYEKANVILSAASDGALLYFIAYYLFASKMPGMKLLVKRLAWVYVACFFALLILNYGSPVFTAINYGLKILVYCLALSICVIGLVKRISYFPFIVIAALLLIGTEAFLAADLFGIWNGLYPPLRVLFIIIGYTSPYFAYTAYISIDFAETSKQLVKEHATNERLTREKYQQEIATRKLLEAQNLELERNVEERTREIYNQKKELEEQSEKIKELDKVKSRFFANISHEFRTPLTLILGPVKRRLSLTEDASEQRDLKSVFQNANRLLQLVNQLLDLTKIESGLLTLHVRRTDLNSFVKFMADAFRSMAELKGVQLTVNLCPHKVEVFVDREKLDKIINNLLSNAFKFIQSDGIVSVGIEVCNPSANYPDGHVEIHVSDSGIGIEPEHLTRIFDRFYQVDNSSTRKFEGTGIGLALTRELVELHKGSIHVTSEIGRGSKFTVELPLGTSHFGQEVIVLDDQLGDEIISDGALPSVANAVNDGIKRDTILIIEDNAELRTYVKDNFREHYHLLEAKDGKEGLVVAYREIPDLIISDVMMPLMDGFQVCKSLKEDERTSHVPIILLTARADSKSKIDGLDTGADDYIAKPFDMDELKARVRNLIENRKLLQEKWAKQILLKPREVAVESMDDKFVRKATEIVEQHIPDSSFSVEVFAREIGMSLAQLYRKISALTGFTPNDLIRNMRLQYASELLRQRAGNVADIAYQSGFNNLSYFSKCFREKFGCSPSEFVKKENLQKDLK